MSFLFLKVEGKYKTFQNQNKTNIGYVQHNAYAKRFIIASAYTFAEDRAMMVQIFNTDSTIVAMCTILGNHNFAFLTFTMGNFYVFLYMILFQKLWMDAKNTIVNQGPLFVNIFVDPNFTKYYIQKYQNIYYHQTQIYVDQSGHRFFEHQYLSR